MDITIAIVSYNIQDLLDKCIRSVINQTLCVHEIIVVDNNSQDDTAKIIKSNYPAIKLIQNNVNIGFAKANNQAFKQANGRYIFMLNPDTVILNGAIDKLVNFMDSHPEAGACGPKNLNPDGSLQYNCHHFPSITTNIFTHLQLARKYPRSRIFGKGFMTYWDYNETKEVDWITGSSLMIRKKALEETGLLDENYFVYSEEADFCFRLKKRNWKIFFYPDASIIHYGGQSVLKQSDKEVVAKSIVEYLFASKYYFFKKNYGYIHFMVIKLTDIICYMVVYIKNLLRRQKNIKEVKLNESRIILKSILSS